MASSPSAKNNAWVNKAYFLDEKSYANSLLIFKVAEWIPFYQHYIKCLKNSGP